MTPYNHLQNRFGPNKETAEQASNSEADFACLQFDSACHNNNFSQSSATNSSGSKARSTKRLYLAGYVIFSAGGIATIIYAQTQHHILQKWLNVSSYLLGNTPQLQTPQLQSTILPVKTVEADPISSYTVTRSYSGSIVPQRSSPLSFARGEEIVSITVNEGDTVTAGQPLAYIDTRNLAVTQLDVEAKRVEAQEQLQEMKTGPRQETIAAAQATVASFESRLALAKQQQSRRQALHEEGAISQEDLDEAISNVGALLAQRDAAQSYVDELLAGTRQEVILGQEARLAQIEASLKNLDIDFEKSILRAPYSGTISQRLVDEGVVVAPGQPVLHIVEDKSLEVRVGIPQSTLPQIKLGRTYPLQVGQKSYSGRATAILPEIDPNTNTVTAVFTLEANTGNVATPGQLVTLSLAETIATDGFWLPVQALVERERGLWSCYVMEPASNLIQESPKEVDQYIVVQKYVDILHTEGDHVLVRGMLQPGDRIIESTLSVVPGQRVRPAI